jgi:hypothetical protein
MTNRLVKTVNDCKIYYNSEYEEFTVKPLWSRDEASHYFTDDLDDAEDTTVSMWVKWISSTDLIT